MGFEKLFKPAKPSVATKSPAHMGTLLRQYRREFGHTNGTKWFCENVPIDEARKRHAKLTGVRQFASLFRPSA
jgi:hypothetical protein